MGRDCPKRRLDIQRLLREFHQMDRRTLCALPSQTWRQTYEYVGVTIATGSGFELSNGRWGFQRQTLVQSSEAMLSLIGEFARFLWARKKFWLIPIMAIMLTVGGLLVLSQGSVVAPFIYTLF